MSDDITARARAALEDVTESDWLAAASYPTRYEVLSSLDGAALATLHGDRAAENACFIAAARSLLPELLAEVERLRGGRSNHEVLMSSAGEQYDKLAVEVERLRGALDRMVQRLKAELPLDREPFSALKRSNVIADIEVVLWGGQ